jgi:hypothetical protein
MEMKMKYHNGNIELANYEIALLSSITHKRVEKSYTAPFFIFCMDSLRQEIFESSVSLKDDPDYLANEKDVNLALGYMTQICNQYKARAILLVSAAGDEMVMFGQGLDYVPAT